MLDFMTKAVETVNSWGSWGIALYIGICIVFVAGAVSLIASVVNKIRG